MGFLAIILEISKLLLFSKLPNYIGLVKTTFRLKPYNYFKLILKVEQSKLLFIQNKCRPIFRVIFVSFLKATLCFNKSIV